MAAWFEAGRATRESDDEKKRDERRYAG